jgi:hypothetical protein
VEEAYDPPRIVMPVKGEENFFVNLCYPTSIEMATLLIAFSYKFPV